MNHDHWTSEQRLRACQEPAYHWTYEQRLRACQEPAYHWTSERRLRACQEPATDFPAAPAWRAKSQNRTPGVHPLGVPKYDKTLLPAALAERAKGGVQ